MNGLLDKWRSYDSGFVAECLYVVCGWIDWKLKDSAITESFQDIDFVIINETILEFFRILTDNRLWQEQESQALIFHTTKYCPCVFQSIIFQMKQKVI